MCVIFDKVNRDMWPIKCNNAGSNNPIGTSSLTISKLSTTSIHNGQEMDVLMHQPVSHFSDFDCGGGKAIHLNISNHCKATMNWCLLSCDISWTEKSLDKKRFQFVMSRNTMQKAQPSMWKIHHNLLAGIYVFSMMELPVHFPITCYDSLQAVHLNYLQHIYSFIFFFTTLQSGLVYKSSTRPNSGLTSMYLSHSSK